MAFELWEGKLARDSEGRDRWIDFEYVGAYPTRQDAHDAGWQIWSDSRRHGLFPDVNRLWGADAGETEDAFASPSFVYARRFIIKEAPE
ncbi:MAG: hypothetical protein ABGY41_09895 [Candidatus Poribacteria bacterium]